MKINPSMKYFFLFIFLLSLICSSYSETYNKEFVFAKGMGNLNAGISPAVSNKFMFAPNAVSEKRTLIPPIMVSGEFCVYDFSNFGSIGTIFQIEFSRYQYLFLKNDNDERVKINTNQMLFPMVGLTYHYTLVTRLEVYLKGVVGFLIRDTNLDDELKSDIVFQIGAGIRYYFINSIGAYIEGGYTTGYLTAGVSYRW